MPRVRSPTATVSLGHF